MNRRILIVDDSEDHFELMKFVFADLRCEVVSAKSVSEAEVLVNNESFSVVLMDISLHDGSGIDLCRKLRESNPLLPIIFNSGYSQQRIIDEAIDAGANAYLLKPTDFDELIAIVSSHLNG